MRFARNLEQLLDGTILANGHLAPLAPLARRLAYLLETKIARLLGNLVQIIVLNYRHTVLVVPVLVMVVVAVVVVVTMKCSRRQIKC